MPLVFGLPIIQILLFGYAINTDVRNIQTAVANQANTHLSREFIANVGATQVVDIVEYVETPGDLEDRLRRGEISIGIVLPADFDRRVVDGNRAAVHILVDGSDPTILGVANQLQQIPLGFNTAGPDNQRANLIETRAYYNPRTTHAREHRARSNGCHSDDDDDAVHGRRHRA